MAAGLRGAEEAPNRCVKMTCEVVTEVEDVSRAAANASNSHNQALIVRSHTAAAVGGLPRGGALGPVRVPPNPDEARRELLEGGRVPPLDVHKVGQEELVLRRQGVLTFFSLLGKLGRPAAHPLVAPTRAALLQPLQASSGPAS